MTSPRLGLPWYVHPAEDDHAWTRLARRHPRPSFVVVNVEDGPGAPEDPWYPASLARLAGLRLLGYVDVRYGQRPPREVRDDVRTWLGRYRTAGIMLDRVPADQGSAKRCREYVAAARRDAAEFVVGNPGTTPAAEYLAMFDVTCVFEGSALSYADFRPGTDLRQVPRGRVWHLVHTCPPASIAALTRRAGRLGAGHAFVTDRRLPHPWGGFPLSEEPADGDHTV